MSSQSYDTSIVAAYTLHAWEHPSPYLRLLSPWRWAGAHLEKGAHWDQVSIAAIELSDLVHLHRDFPRYWSAYQQVVETARALGKPVVFDLDDLLLELPAEHPDRQYHFASDALFPILQAIVEADVVTVSTPLLHDRVSQLNPNTLLLPTCLDDSLWSLKPITIRENPLPCIIGWINDQIPTGAETSFINGVARFLRQRGRRALLRIWGNKPPEDLLRLPNVDWLPELPQDYPGYVDYLTRQSCDIFVTPQREGAYFGCQSPLRYLEQAACGAPGIYSCVLPYPEVIEQRQNGILAGTAEEWEAALSEMTDAPVLRREVAAAAQQAVRQGWSLSGHASLWSNLLEQAGSLTAQRRENQAVIDQVRQVANQARQWQRDLQRRLYDRDWEVDALNVMLKRKERQASEYIDQLGAQLQSIWDDPAWRLLHKARRLVQVVSKPANQPQIPSAPTSAAAEQSTPPLAQRGITILVDALPPARTFDVLVFAPGNWEALPAHQQRFLSYLEAQGSRLFIITQTNPPGAAPSLSQVQRGIYSLAMPTVEQGQEQIAHGWLAQLRLEAGIQTALCWLGDSAWAETVFTLRNTFGWKIVSLPTGLSSQSPEDETIRLRSDLVLEFPPADDQHPSIMQRLLELFPQVSLVILTYNNLDYNRQCLESIYAKTAYPNYEVVVVDNASSDGTPDYLRNFAAAHPNLRLVLNGENRGFSAGNNQGVSASSGEYVAFLNNDIVVTPGWLSGLLNHLRDPAVGAVGPVTNFAGNESRIAVGYSDIQGLDGFSKRYCAAHAGEAREIRMLALFCLLTRRAVLETVGPLDEQFGVGMYEDDDFSLRMRQKGYRILCAEDVYIHHWGSASFSRLAEEHYQRLHEENRHKFEAKWGTEWQPHRWRMEKD